MKIDAALLVSMGLFSLLATDVFACGVQTKQSSSKKFVSKKGRSPDRKISCDEIAEFAKGHPAQTWETRLGNLLLTYHSEKVGPAVISLPVKLPKGDWPPFGDGQRNAKMEFAPDWKHSEFPAIGIESLKNGQSQR